jgi:murein DD-endopeptidase MepM/ murein hydrolase activator NlpD
MAANLQAVSVSIPPGAVFGEQSTISARFNSTDLVAGTPFNVQVLFNGQVLLSQDRTAQQEGERTYSATVEWFARPGQIELRVDAGDAIDEADETDNVTTLDYTPAAPALANKFVFPVSGQVLRDWFITSYVDVDPRPDQYADFRDGPYSYDSHFGVDFSLSKRFPGMDRGVPVYAVADGIVTSLVDGTFDRETTGGGAQNNFVAIDHGNGISTDYHHLAANTIAVRAGDRVAAGQLLGLVGSSGASIAAHLHFDVYHQGRLVETSFAPEVYWAEPQPYMSELPITIRDSAITNYSFPPAVFDFVNLSDAKEIPSEIRNFSVTSEWSVNYWFSAAPNHTGDTAQVRWYRPDGALEKTQDLLPLSQETPERADRLIANLQTLEHARWSQFPGTWQVAPMVNGIEIDRQSFEVMTGPGVPEIRVTQGDTYIIDGRTTPIDFGRAAASPRVLTFTIQNHGSVELATSDLELPPGFSLVGNFPSSVTAGATADFQVQLDTGPRGSQFGQIRFHTNDADERDFNFNVQGTTMGAISPGAPQIRLTQPAVVYKNGGAPQLLATSATLADSDSASFNTGHLQVELASGASPDDRLAIRNQGSAASEIGVLADSVTFGGVTIGSYSGGQGETPLVVTFNENATLAAIEHLVRNLTFANLSQETATNHRYVRLALVDDTGQTSNLPIAHALVDPRPILPEVLPGDFSGNGRVEQADLDLVLLHWGQDGAGTPATWTGPPASGQVDQGELDAVLLNWGATSSPSVASIAPPLPAAVRESATDSGFAQLPNLPKPLPAPVRDFAFDAFPRAALAHPFAEYLA